MKLKRHFENDFGTFGELTTESGLILQTLECQYKSNKRFISCVPPGEYQLIDTDSTKHGKTVALVNHDLHVRRFQEGYDARYAILFHIANTVNQLQGCIAVGMDIGCVRGKWAITHSTKAMELLKKEFNQDSRLIIE